ncbi:MAG TPA: hypothetical protein VF234_09490 [Limnochordia bacterium]
MPDPSESHRHPEADPDAEQYWAIRWKPTGAYLPGHLDKPVLFKSEYRAWRFVEALRRQHPDKAPPPVDIVRWTRPPSEGQVFEVDPARELILDLEQAAAHRAFEGRVRDARRALQANAGGIKDLLSITAAQGLEELDTFLRAQGLPPFDAEVRALLQRLLIGAAWRGVETGYGLGPYLDAWLREEGGAAGDGAD